jgi:hypothetical protein
MIRVALYVLLGLFGVVEFYRTFGDKDRFVRHRLFGILLILAACSFGITTTVFHGPMHSNIGKNYLNFLPLCSVAFLMMDIGFRMYRKPHLLVRVGIPLMVAIVAVKTAVFITLAVTSSNIKTCKNYSMMVMNLCDFLVSAGFVVLSIMTRKKLASLPTLGEFGLSKLKQFSALIAVYMVGSIIALGNQIMSMFMSKDMPGDNCFFRHAVDNQLADILYGFIAFILPCAATLLVFHNWNAGRPVQVYRHSDESQTYDRLPDSS